MTASFTLATPSSKGYRSHLEWVAVAIIVCLLLSGFLFNRVVSNVGMFLAGVYALTQIPRWSHLRFDPVMGSLLLMCLLPLLSDIFLESTGFYRHRGVMKWILVLFPCFIFAVPRGRQTIRLVHTLFLLAMLVSTLYSLWHYIADFGTMAARYKVSKVMPTLSLGDHIRIGWLTVLSCVVAFYESRQNTLLRLRWVYRAYIFLQVVFLHLLGAKTGLLTLYLSAIVVVAYLLPKGRKWWTAAMGAGIVLLPVMAYFTIPSLRERFHFIKYDFEHYMRDEYREGLSDAVRLYSLRAGWDAVKNHPVSGTGFSRLQGTCNEWYKIHVPSLKSDNYFLASSQILIYGASAGWLGWVVVVIFIAMPLLRRDLRTNTWWMTFYIPAALTLSYETHLEGQLPLFAWSFFFAWFWRLAAQVESEQTNDADS